MSNLRERFEAWHLKEFGFKPTSVGSHPQSEVYFRGYQACAAELMPAIEKMRDALDMAELRIDYLGNISQGEKHYEANLKTFLPAIRSAKAEADKILEGGS